MHRLLPALLALACATGTRSSTSPSPARAAGSSPSAPPSPGPSAPAGDDAADLRFQRDLAETASFSLGRPSAARPTPDGKQVLFLRSEPRRSLRRLYVFDVASAQVRELVTPEQILKGAAERLSAQEKARRERMRMRYSGFTSYQLSEAGDKVLVSLGGRVYVLTLADGAAREVVGPGPKGEPAFDAKLSPDGALVSFVRAGELWVAKVAGGPARPVTSGATATKTHAQAEFVAQEEMDRFTGYWWSPDSRLLVYEEADAAKVESLFLADPVDPMAKVEPAPYPRPGRANVEVTLGIVPVGGGRTTWIDWDRARYPYLARVLWQEHAPLTLVVQTRDQRDLGLLAVDPKSGRTHELLHEHDDTWVSLNQDYEWLRDGSGFLWPSERGGAWQLELRAPDGKLVRTLTKPGFGFDGVRYVDLERRRVVVLAGAEPVDHQLYELLLAGGPPEPLTRGPQVHDATFARSSRVHVLSSGSVGSFGTLEVFRADGSLAGALPSVAVQPPFLPRVEIAKVGPGPGFWSALVKPRNFDRSRRYPIIVDVYGGPGTRVVSPSASHYVRAQWMADHGFLVAFIDGRGTPGRGHAWERAIFQKFAEVPLADQVTALEALAAREPAIDLRRVGIIGHSFGGYMAALAVLRRPDVFRAAVASAPVVDWLDYDTHYTERYLGVPAAEDSQIYQQNGLLKYAPALERPLLLIHGTADDNVHFNQTLKLSDALFRAGRRFELIALPRQTHLFYEPQLAFRYWQRVFAFFREHLSD
ncbi:MAG TPA: DPP IV N-terminal domain-containing protein [Polyangia bacterium]|nr:DPP IV N-terminal domain-containing protein [Polyangia bacterium]